MRRSKNGPEPSARGNFTPPPRGAAPAPVSGPEPTAPPASSGGRFSPRNWRVPTRLNAILLIPVIVGLVMGGFQVKSSIDTWREAEDAESTARLVRAALSYADALYNERDSSAAPLLSGQGQDNATVVAARKKTDEAADAFDEAAQNMPQKAGLERRLKLFRDGEGSLQTLRAGAYTSSKLTGVKTEEGYTQVAHPLTEFANELGLGTGNITSYGRTVYAIELTKAALSLQRSIGMHLLIKPGPGLSSFASQKVALSSYAYLEGIAVEEYVGGGTEADAAKLDTAKKQIQTEGAALAKEAAAKNPDYVPPPSNPTDMVSGIAQLPSMDESARQALAKDGVTAENWWAVNTLKYNAYRQIETDLADTAVNEAASIADSAKRDAFIVGAAVVVALLLAFILAGAVARQMSRSMRQLRNAAFGIAEQRLPMLVDQLSRTDPGRVDTRVAPIPITTKDEIGEVARAFDQVHREAVRLASEQALLRGNINAIFTNLSRRNQSLIEGQLTLITDLENNEADPDQLENLFRLDHLATRMRRNGENLLVLAGEEPGRRWDQPVPLVDVLRAASSEVEQYERIELSGVPEAEIHGRAVTDLVHLLAELLENATTFSSPQTKVRVTATRLPDGRIMIEIHDKGIGLTAEDFADINHKLANPPTVDAAISQRMGLFVVGRLSDRHGIRVQLRPSGEQAGTTSLVMLPDAITHGGGGEQQPAADEFTVSQIIPEQQFQGENFTNGDNGLPMRTAAELGFDDSRYSEVPDDIRELDPVGRSLMREERRAALEAQNQDQPAALQGPEPSYTDGFDASPGVQQNGYDNGRNGYAEQQPASYDQQTSYEEAQQAPYEEQRQTAYEEPNRPAYEEPYFAQNGGLPQNDTFSQGGGYPEPSYAEPVQEEPAAVHAAAPETFSGFEERRYQDDWPQSDGYRGSYPDQYAPEAESAQAADVSERERVGFDRPGPAPASVGHELTDAGLPRRGSTGSGANGSNGTRNANQESPASAPESNGGGDIWRSANDARWQQASQLRKPKAGGVTSSGLPRRVPKANLVEGAAEATHQGGPQVSRAPEDVRGRLSNLRRGVQRGRNAGSETNGQGFGPDSTYNQER
ncbi:signal transduction histidine kinase [Streptomyces sp. SAI-135]|uniref:sensor histidine kinase n=1 Tax=unclassified Streptomyces TaxID=2593676 RepID=UPI0024766D2B|nr:MULTISPECIES: nitrate- and nitrite sensing domain-containing protein [unclassified Streptomyces]MDH6516275.1 signal transduction histidine kinase [Streptomyces sp. SAI-090]MDH6548473.1 signal transduction histidine kinase [Streptomyces sp. SAI-041]MDH6567565.1 signal transduction histidine kinase [Streptomyces sp. SAI-117]MDH6619634.1 signal transduction histidine kinase [Streptomyces sp. SAI-135]